MENLQEQKTNQIPEALTWYSKTKINRKQYLIFSILLPILIFGIFFGLELIFGNSLFLEIIIFISAVIIFIANIIIERFRLNDISPDTQAQLWNSGNMWIVRRWMLLLAPSSSEGSSYHDTNKILLNDGKMNWSVLGHNAARFIIYFILICIIVFGLYSIKNFSI